MPLENPGVVDFIGTDKATGAVVLTVADAWDWSDEPAHLELLKDKLNTYLEFIESGQLEEEYPDAAGRARRVDIVAKHPLPSDAAAFLANAAQTMREGYGVTLIHRVLAPN
jgi:hypothetical protein